MKRTPADHAVAVATRWDPVIEFDDDSSHIQFSTSGTAYGMQHARAR
jgi:hypothetical protein